MPYMENDEGRKIYFADETVIGTKSSLDIKDCNCKDCKYWKPVTVLEYLGECDKLFTIDGDYIKPAHLEADLESGINTVVQKDFGCKFWEQKGE